MSHPKYQIQDLEYLMSRLRDPETGCPWDLKQNWQSIVSHSLEEVYELVEAIENQDFDHTKEELGDLLFHIIFYSQFAKEEKHFEFQDVVQLVVEKLIRRHPHVFPDGTLESQRTPGQTISDKEINKRWDQIKAEEKSLKPQKNISKSKLDVVPSTFPALQQADKLQKVAAKTGFDWADPLDVFPQFQSEIEELKRAIENKDIVNIEEELGDLFFTLVNLSRKLNINSEDALRKSNLKFRSRFKEMESISESESIDFEKLEMEEKEVLWQKAKSRLAQADPSE